MRQFDVFPNPEPRHRERIPYLLVLQSDLLESLDNVVVAPLRRQIQGIPVPVSRLNPAVDIEGICHFVRIQELAAIPAQKLRHPLANLASRRDDILAALDVLFTGL
jgi:toxin CcdB